MDKHKKISVTKVISEIKADRGRPILSNPLTPAQKQARYRDKKEAQEVNRMVRFSHLEECEKLLNQYLGFCGDCYASVMPPVEWVNTVRVLLGDSNIADIEDI